MFEVQRHAHDGRFGKQIRVVRPFGHQGIGRFGEGQLQVDLDIDFFLHRQRGKLNAWQFELVDHRAVIVL